MCFKSSAPGHPTTECKIFKTKHVLYSRSTKPCQHCVSTNPCDSIHAPHPYGKQSSYQKFLAGLCTATLSSIHIVRFAGTFSRAHRMRASSSYDFRGLEFISETLERFPLTYPTVCRKKKCSYTYSAGQYSYLSGRSVTIIQLLRYVLVILLAVASLMDWALIYRARIQSKLALFGARR